MDRKTPDKPMWQYERHARFDIGDEFYNGPSALASQCWYYVTSIGQATVPSGFCFQAERNDAFLLHYQHRGDLRFMVRDRDHLVRQNEVCLMDMNESLAHSNTTSRLTQTWWLSFNSRDMPRMFTELRAESDPVFHLTDPARFETLFLDLLSLTRDRPPAYEAKSSAILMMMIAQLFDARAHDGLFLPTGGKRSDLSGPVRRGLDYMIRFHTHADLALKRVYGVSGLSLCHFVRRFRQEVGVSPMRYLNLYRIDRAKALLAESDKTLAEIARQVGASTQTYFSYLFRQQTGLTPSAYRARARRLAHRKYPPALDMTRRGGPACVVRRRPAG